MYSVHNYYVNKKIVGIKFSSDSGMLTPGDVTHAYIELLQYLQIVVEFPLNGCYWTEYNWNTERLVFSRTAHNM